MSADQSSVDDFIDCSLLVPGAGDNELVVGGDIAAENRRRLLRLDTETGGVMLAAGGQLIIFLYKDILMLAVIQVKMEIFGFPS